MPFPKAKALSVVSALPALRLPFGPRILGSRFSGRIDGIDVSWIHMLFSWGGGDLTFRRWVGLLPPASVIVQSTKYKILLY